MRVKSHTCGSGISVHSCEHLRKHACALKWKDIYLHCIHKRNISRTHVGEQCLFTHANIYESVYDENDGKICACILSTNETQVVYKGVNFLSPHAHWNIPSKKTVPKTFLSYFEKKNPYVSGLSVCISVALCVRISVAGANKVEGTMG